jgi:hypothetical protein
MSGLAPVLIHYEGTKGTKVTKNNNKLVLAPS